MYSLILRPDGSYREPEDSVLSQEETERAEYIAAWLQKHPAALKAGSRRVIRQGQYTYLASIRVYHGTSDGYSVSQKEGAAGQDYYVVVYANISQLQQFADLMRRILWGAMGLSGLLSVLLIYGFSKQLDDSFRRLKDYITAVGRRESTGKPEKLNYREFLETADRVEEMSELLSKAQESQKQFFQNASHELRTPLMSIQGYAEGIEAGVIRGEEVRSSAGIIVGESQRMSHLVDEILQISRMDSGQQELTLEEIDLKELLYDCAWQVKSAADKRSVSIRQDFPEKDLYMEGDERKLEQVFRNILSNACRYADREILIRLELTDRILVRIRDDGQEIVPEDLPHIFERFYKGKGGNFGIGLALTRELVKLHGGEIQVNSRPGCTEFLVALPQFCHKVS